MSVSRHAAAAALLSAFLSPSAFAACYVVYAPDNEVVYRDTIAPVDLSRPLSDTLPRIAPGATMVFSMDNQGCEVPVNKLPLPAAASATGSGAGSAMPLARPARADRG